MKVVGNYIFLKILKVDDVSQSYVQWMNDKEVTQFLESRWTTYTLDDLKKYVRTKELSNKDKMFGIFMKDSSEHIGNIKIGDINPKHRYGDVGIIIGDRTEWGKGYATEAIKLVTNYAFDELKLNKLYAGIYGNQIASYKAFIKAGYREAGRLSKHLFYKGTFVDKILVEKCK